MNWEEQGSQGPAPALVTAGPLVSGLGGAVAKESPLLLQVICDIITPTQPNASSAGPSYNPGMQRLPRI